MQYQFKWRTIAFIVIDHNVPTHKVIIDAKNLDEAFKIWREKHLDENLMPDLNQIEIVQFKNN